MEIKGAKRFIFFSITTGMLILAALSLPVAAACIGCVGLPTDPACCFAGSGSGIGSYGPSSGGMGDVTTGSGTQVAGLAPGGKFYIGDGFSAWVSGDQKTIITYNQLDGFKVEQITAIEVITPGSDANNEPPGSDMFLNPLDSLDLNNDMGMNTPVRQDLFDLPDGGTGSDNNNGLPSGPDAGTGNGFDQVPAGSDTGTGLPLSGPDAGFGNGLDPGPPDSGSDIGLLFTNPGDGDYDNLKIPGNPVDEFNSMLIPSNPSKKGDVDVMALTDLYGNKVITETKYNDDGSSVTTTTKFTQDGVRDETTEIRSDISGNREVAVTEYDVNGNPTSTEETKYNSAGDKIETVTHFGTDGMLVTGTTETRTDPAGNRVVSEMQFDFSGNEIISSESYDAEGNKVGVSRTVTDEDGNTVTAEIKTNIWGYVVTSRTKTDPSGNKVIVEERIENGVVRGYTETKIDSDGSTEIRELDFSGNEVSSGTSSKSKVTQSDRLSWINSDTKLELIKRFYGPEILGIEE